MLAAAATLAAANPVRTVGVAGAQQEPTRGLAAARDSRAAASAGLDTLRALARTQFRTLGFRAPDEAAAATLGEPVVKYLVRLDSLRAYTQATSPAALLSGGDRMMYPVLVGGNATSSIEVARTRGAWRPVAYGGATFAATVVGRRRPLAAAERRAESDYFIVRVPALGLVFLGADSPAGLALTPLANDPRGRWRAGTSLPAATVFGQLVADARAANGEPI